MRGRHAGAARKTSWRYDGVILSGLYSAPPAYPLDGHQGIRIDYAVWLGRRPTPAERVHLSRNLTSLEARSLVQRLPGRRAVLTETGRVLARKFDRIEFDWGAAVGRDKS